MISAIQIYEILVDLMFCNYRDFLSSRYIFLFFFFMLLSEEHTEKNFTVKIRNKGICVFCIILPILFFFSYQTVGKDILCFS